MLIPLKGSNYCHTIAISTVCLFDGGIRTFVLADGSFRRPPSK